MADKLRSFPEALEITAEKFVLDLDDNDRRAFAADPRAFLYEALRREGAPAPNAILMSGPVNETRVGGFVELIHINSGPFASYYWWPPLE